VGEGQAAEVLAGSVFLEDEPFEYLADPLAIFRGWLIAAGAVVLYWLATRFSPLLGLAVTLAIAALIPWVVVKSRIFNFRNRAHRNIRFSYAPKYGEAYRVLLGLSLLYTGNGRLLAPYVICRQKRFLVENTSYGTTPFRFTARPGEYYKVFLFAFLWLLGAFFALGFLIGVTGLRRSGWQGGRCWRRSFRSRLTSPSWCTPRRSWRTWRGAGRSWAACGSRAP
jgi:uncharacterized membrane protein YjgN (DUF898 family)